MPKIYAPQRSTVTKEARDAICLRSPQNLLGTRKVKSQKSKVKKNSSPFPSSPLPLFPSSPLP